MVRLTWIDQPGDDLGELQEAARPAVDEDEGDGGGAVGALVHKVQVDGVDGQGEMVETLVQVCLLCPPVIGADPVL